MQALHRAPVAAFPDAAVDVPAEQQQREDGLVEFFCVGGVHDACLITPCATDYAVMKCPMPRWILSFRTLAHVLFFAFFGDAGEIARPSDR